MQRHLGDPSSEQEVEAEDGADLSLGAGHNNKVASLKVHQRETKEMS